MDEEKAPQEVVEEESLEDGVDAQAIPEQPAAESQEQTTPSGEGESPDVEPPADDTVPAGDDADDTSIEGEEPPGFDPVLLNAAGLTEEQAQQQFGSPEAFENAVRWLNSRFVTAGQQYLGQQQFQTPPQPQRQQYQPPMQVQQPSADVPQSGQPQKFELPPPPDGQEWDDGTKAIVNHLNQYYQAQMQQQASQLAQQQQAIDQHRQYLEFIAQENQRKQERDYVNTLDGFVSELGDEWKGVFGSGTGYELPKNSLFFQNRMMLDTFAAQLAAGRRAYGQPDLNVKDVLRLALHQAFPDQQKQSVRREVVEQVTKRKGMRTQRPTQRRSQKMSREDRAAQVSKEWYEKNGMPVVEDDFDYNTF